MKEDGLEILEDLLFGIKNPTSGKLTLFGGGQSELFTGRFTQKNPWATSPPTVWVGVPARKPLSRKTSSPIGFQTSKSWDSLLPEAVRSFFQRIQRAFRIQGKGEDAMGSLSGGNVQKFILTREIEKNPPLSPYRRAHLGIGPE
jgi:ABC-type uncharacterized transport system ATPase subunit